MAKCVIDIALSGECYGHDHLAKASILYLCIDIELTPLRLR